MDEITTKILDAGASIIIHPVGWHNQSCIGVAVKMHGFHYGLRCSDLSEGLERAYEWVRDLEFYHGTQWTTEQLERMTMARA